MSPSTVPFRTLAEGYRFYVTFLGCTPADDIPEGAARIREGTILVNGGVTLALHDVGPHLLLESRK
jgi:hypothetical protein